MRSPPILVLGGDGYVGWPVGLALAARAPERRVVLVDNGLRRRLVDEVGGRSVTPIRTLDERVEAARRVLGLPELHAARLDVTAPALDDLLRDLRPGVVVHLAQQASAPYSMRGPDEALFTLHNNEAGNLRLLWALKRWLPDTHLVKLGTFGEYARAGLDVAEGYFRPQYAGRVATRPMPYPREADDVYHITKINDSAFISMACRKWGLRVTDLMQSTVYGLHTPETAADPALQTRFDQDACFGTVVNRFLCQALVDHPLTVYGTGLQRTGLMYLADTVASMVALAEEAPAAGAHRVVNHVTERDPCVLELAERVAEVAAAAGLTPRINVGEHNPRAENDEVKADHRVEAHYVTSRVAHTELSTTLPRLLSALLPHRDRIEEARLPPDVRWGDAS